MQQLKNIFVIISWKHKNIFVVLLDFSTVMAPIVETRHYGMIRSIYAA